MRDGGSFPDWERRAGKRADDAGRHTGSIHAFLKFVPDYFFPKSADADGETGKVRRFPMGDFGTPGDLAERLGLGENGLSPAVPLRQTTDTPNATTSDVGANLLQSIFCKMSRPHQRRKM